MQWSGVLDKKSWHLAKPLASQMSLASPDVLASPEDLASPDVLSWRDAKSRDLRPALIITF
ncbi:hypothetical protein COCHEDRAFT_1219842 [Bipolaris maydis C5]|uniref:Uncharacterized protein n=1 Tax=Cochliobolus heterostrophus (strain C5 / ATCC 48332 / race O) TaxID=701091 RepID=M2SHJ8_COCH5|nr:hypothetical protein COCHEDRAFT_1219842 [Bipolaris maydis C5]